MKKPIALVLALMLSASSVWATGVPFLVNFQGKLLNTSNNPESGAIGMQFRLFNVASGGTAIWGPESQTPTVTNGVFAVQLGAVTALSTDVFVGGPVYLGITVSPDVFPGGEMSPRQQLVASPYAYTAAQLSQSSDIRINPGVVYSTFSQTGNLFVPNGIQAATGTFTATGVNYSITTSSGILVNGTNTAVQAPYFIGNGSLLTGIGGAISAGSIDTSDIATDAVIDSSILAGTITGIKLAAGTIGSSNIAAGAITSAQIAAGTIGSSNLAANSVTSAAILNGTITTADIANGAINTALIATDAVIDSSILDATITGVKIAAGTINSTNILAGTIGSAQISAAAGITGAQIAAGTIGTANLAVNSVTSAAILNGTITGADIALGTVDSTNLVPNLRRTVVLAANVTSIVTTFTSTGLSFPMTSGTPYRFEATILFNNTSASRGTRWTVNNASGSPTRLAYRGSIPFNSTSDSVFFNTAMTSGQIFFGTSAPNSSANVAVILGVIVPSANDTLTIAFGADLTTANTVTILAGSTLEWW